MLNWEVPWYEVDYQQNDLNFEVETSILAENTLFLYETGVFDKNEDQKLWKTLCRWKTY